MAPTSPFLSPELRAYLEEAEKRRLQQSSPEFQGAQIAQQRQAYDAQTRPVELAAMAKALSNVGAVGGRTTDTSALDMAAENSANQARAQQDLAMNQRAQDEKQFGMRGDVARYLQDKYMTQKDKEADRLAKQQENEADRAFKREQARQEQDAKMALASAANSQGSGPSAVKVDPIAERNSQESRYRYLALQKNAEKLKGLIKKHGTFEAMGPASSQMDSLIYQMAVDYAKLVDPSSVAREGEVAAAQKYMLPIKDGLSGGLFTRNSTAESLIDNYQKDLDSRLQSRVQSGDSSLDLEELRKLADVDREQAVPDGGSGVAFASEAYKPKVQEGYVLVRNPAGQIGQIPKANLENALRNNYQLVEEE